jgi:uncharacterized LabA/DUF88 family protein
MTVQFARVPQTGKPSGPPQHAPHAALLIDFDNVTMGIRSDITKELKNLLNSDIIKGKVAVQRAYADWRRYPQYVVPLAEASVDLIFAPAYGSSKKNATDIRLSIDALELVFTRAEIGTFILLSGDSDFSSLVLKLKEYGKYVIGVGIRESASDLLVQNCDEYYSYSALTGLTRAGEEEPAANVDPWELVELAVQQMVSNDDVMRSDRLKQVLLDLDPNFDEKTLGFSKFNRFVAEASNRGVLKLHKMDNGQFEIALPDALPPVDVGDHADGRARAPRRRREPREARTDRDRRPRVAERAPAASAPEPPAERIERPKSESRAEPQPQRRDGDGRREGSVDALRAAYDLLRRATRELGATEERAVRDSDVKRRMLDIQPEWDESPLGFSKFSRFLRQAHDAEVINLRKVDNGNYEVALPHSDELTAGAEPQPQEAGRRRGRRREAGDAAVTTVAPAEPAPRARAESPPSAPATPAAPAPAVPAPAATTPAPAREPGSPASIIGLRRGTKGPRIAAPPRVLEGQGVPARSAAATGAGAPTAAASSKPASLAQLRLPTSRDAVIDYLTRSYHGIGRKSAASLVEAVGPTNVFAALHEAPDRVREVLGAKRGESLIEQWQADFAKRTGSVAPGKGETQPDGTNEAARDATGDDDTAAPDDGRTRSSRGRRGGRRRSARGRSRTPAGSG